MEMKNTIYQNLLPIEKLADRCYHLDKEVSRCNEFDNSPMTKEETLAFEEEIAQHGIKIQIPDYPIDTPWYLGDLCWQVLDYVNQQEMKGHLITEVFTIQLKGIARRENSDNRIFLNGEELFPKESLKIANHSPDGFNWGYGGSGPAQTALAICLKLFGERKAVKKYKEFKSRYISDLPMGQDFDLELIIQI